MGNWGAEVSSKNYRHYFFNKLDLMVSDSIQVSRVLVMRAAI